MNQTKILTELTDIFKDVLDEEDLALTTTTTADDVEEWDSLAHVQLIVAIERHFGVKFTSQEINSFTTVGDMVQTISDK